MPSAPSARSPARRKSRATPARTVGRGKARKSPAGRGARSRRTGVGQASTRPGRAHTTSRTGAKRAAHLRRTLDGRPRSMGVEFEDLGQADDNSKEARDRRADARRLRDEHPDLYGHMDT